MLDISCRGYRPGEYSSPNCICRFVAINFKKKIGFLTEIRPDACLLHLGATPFIRPGINNLPTRSLSNIIVINYL